MRSPGFSGMDIVDRGEVLNFPGRCVFTGDSEGPFLDTNTYLNARELEGVDPYGYVSVAKVKDMGRAIGMVPKEDVERLTERLEAYAARVEEVERLLNAVQTLDEAEKGLSHAVA